MNEETTETTTPTKEEETTAPETVEEPVSAPVEGKADDKDLKSALAQKDHFKSKFEKAETERIALEKELNAKAQSSPQQEKPMEKQALEVDDFIDISASLDGLDSREKEKLASDHKLSGKPLKELRESEDFTFWQKSYREKVEKERLTLEPSSAQNDQDRPKTLTEKLKGASIADKEKILAEQGLYRSPRGRRSDQSEIGEGK